LIDVYLVINFSLFSLRSYLRFLPNPHPRLHKLKISIKILSPLPYLSLTHQLYTLLLLQKVILSVVHSLLFNDLQYLVNLGGDVANSVRFEILKFIL
jgi:hypothetical protein